MLCGWDNLLNEEKKPSYKQITKTWRILMTAYSYQDWNSLSQDQQAANPGVSIPRDHALNNPNRGVYWSGESSAMALMANAQDVLAGDNKEDAEKMFRAMKSTYRTAVENSKAVTNAMMPRQIDAHRALTSTSFNLTESQEEELQTTANEIYTIQQQAEVEGIDPIAISNYLFQRASAEAVGQKPSQTVPPEFEGYLKSEEGQNHREALNHSVAMLYRSIRKSVDDVIKAEEKEKENDGTEKAEGPSLDLFQATFLGGADRTPMEEMEMMRDIINSIPLERNPLPITPAANFSVRMDTVNEAKAAEVLLRWAGETEQLPEPEVIHEQFAAWHDSGLTSSPYEPRDATRIGLIVGQGEKSEKMLEEVLEDFRDIKESQIVVLTSENKNLANLEEFAGRPIVQTKAKASNAGVEIEGINGAPDNAIFLLNLTHEEMSNAAKRSTAANAFVGSSFTVGHIASDVMHPYEAQAIHLAGTSRKLTQGIDSNGNQLGMIVTGREPIYELAENGFKKIYDEKRILEDSKKYEKMKLSEDKKSLTLNDRTIASTGDYIPLRDEEGKQKVRLIETNQLAMLREKARKIDAEADPNRYYAAGMARPRLGVHAIAFDGARNYDAAARKYANGRDPMAEVYGRVPKHSAILTTDNDKMAAYKWLDENATERGVLWAEAERSLSFAEDTSVSKEGQKTMAREAVTVLKIYDRPASERTGSEDEVVDWNDSRVRGAIILVRGNPTKNVINGDAQATKVAQEAIVDFAHNGVVFDDLKQDYHAAHLTRLALEMGKRFTVVGKEGETVPLTEAREFTRKNAQSFTEVADLEISKRFRGELSGLDVDPSQINRAPNGRRNVAYAINEPVGQMALSNLPGMNDEKAQKLAKLDLTLEEVFTTKDPEVKKALYENGMPSQTVKDLGDRKIWQKAVERALTDKAAGDMLGAEYANSKTHPELIPEGKSAFVYGEKPKMPVAAFIGNAMATFDGPSGKAVPAAEMVDRKQVAQTIKKMSDNGYAIGVAMEEGVGQVVLEEAAKIPGAQVVVATSGNPLATPPEMRMTLRTLLEEERASVVMPTSVGGSTYETTDGIRTTQYVDLRNTMHENLAHASDVGIVVALSSSDQSLHVVDKMNNMDKPIAVLIPEDNNLASTEAYRGGMKIARGAGKTDIESVGLATVPSAQGFAEIKDYDTKMEMIGGVMRGNAGTFQSARISRSDGLRGGHSYKEINWGKPAPVISSEASIDRLVTAHKEGNLEPLGKFKEPTAAELEKRSLARYEASMRTRKTIEDSQKRYQSQIREDAARSVGY